MSEIDAYKKGGCDSGSKMYLEKINKLEEALTKIRVEGAENKKKIAELIKVNDPLNDSNYYG